MDVVGERLGGSDKWEPLVSEQDDTVQETEEVSEADGIERKLPDTKPSHVSFFLDGNQVIDGLPTTSNAPPLVSPTKRTENGTPSHRTLRQNQQGAGACQNQLAILDDKGTTEVSAVVHEEQTEHASEDTETLVGLQQSRSLPDAIALLSKTTQDLEGRVNALLAQHEEEFFASFRSHMAKVKKHVEELQARADEQKNLLERDLRIKTLQQELQWFVNEAVRLDQVCKRLKGDLLSWRARTDALREDRDFLEAELKKAKRKLRSSQLQGSVKLCTPSQEWIEPQGPAAPAPKATATPAIVKSAHAIHGSPPCQPGMNALAHTPSDDPKVLRETVEELKKQVSSLAAANRRLQNEAKRNSRIESNLVEASKALSRRRDLESFFLECINEVRKERKLRGAPTTSLGGFETLSLEEFLAYDRRMVLNALLSNDHVLQKLYSLIFPHPGVIE